MWLLKVPALEVDNLRHAATLHFAALTFVFSSTPSFVDSSFLYLYVSVYLFITGEKLEESNNFEDQNWKR